MKRKNILWGFAMLVVAMVCCWAFTSCDDDKSPVEQPTNPLFGAWQMTSDKATLAQLEQMIAATLAQQGLDPQSIETLNIVKSIVAESSIVVQINADGTSKLYSYRNGMGLFVIGKWTMISEQAILFTVADLQLPVTDLQLNGDTLTCKIGQLPLSFTRYQIQQ